MSKTLGSLPVGALVKDVDTKFLDTPIIWKKADSNHVDYPANSTTLITEKIIARKAVDAKEPSNSDTNRQQYGNNKYSVSNIDQWLNSEAAAGEWYAARHEADQAPDSTSVVSVNPYSSIAGFLNGFSDGFKEALLDTELKVVLNTVTDGGNYESITRKIFFASNTEVGLANENNIAEGSCLALFTDNASRIAQYASTAASDGATVGNNGYWWLRTPSSLNSRFVRTVYSGGALVSYYACHGSGGVRPLCNLSSDTLVSDEPDTDGCYVIEFISVAAPTSINVQEPVYCSPDYETGGIEGGVAKITWGASGEANDGYRLERSINGGDFSVIYTGTALNYNDSISNTMNTVQYRVASVADENLSEYVTSETVVVQDNYPPFISGDNSALGDATTRFKYNYAVYDGDDVNVTVSEYVNEKLIRTYTATGSEVNELVIDLETWNDLPIGDNFIKIVVVDDNDATVTQTKHFNKIGGIIEVEYTPFGLAITECPKMINVKLDLTMPLDAKIKVFATNNANDTQPVWDDITTAALGGHNHVFSNTAKQQGVSYYGVKVKVKIERNGADGDIKLYAIKCQLDIKVD